MANENMTIRLTPDGFSFAEGLDATAELLDEAPFHEIAPGADFQQQLHAQLLDRLSDGEHVPNVTIQQVSTRVMLLPADVTDSELAESMYHLTLGKPQTEEQVILQPLTLSTGQEVTLCFGIDHVLYHFLQRNFGEVSIQHTLSSLLLQGARMASGNCMVVRCDSQFLELALFRQGRLSLVNVYRATQTDNRTYYVMNTWLQEQLDQLQDNLLVVSQNTEGLQVRANLHRFIKHVFG